MDMIVNELDIEDIELLEVIPHAPVDPIAIAADKGGYKPDCSLMELNQAIRVLQQYHVLQRERMAAKIKARLDMIAGLN